MKYLAGYWTHKLKYLLKNQISSLFFLILLGPNYVLMNAIQRIIIICLYALLDIIIVDYSQSIS